MRSLGDSGNLAWPQFESQIEIALERIRLIELRGFKRRRARKVASVVAAAITAFAFSLMAVSSTRGAFIRTFFFGSERIDLIDRLPTLTDNGPLHLGRRSSVKEIEEQPPFRLALPSDSLLRHVDGAWVQGSGDNRQIALLWGSEQRFSLLFTQIRAKAIDRLNERQIASKRLAEPPRRLRIRGAPGLWIGRFHEYVFITARGDRRFLHSRVARNVLLWDAYGLHLRLEGAFSLKEALTIARSIQPRR